MDSKKIEQVIREHVNKFMTIPGVFGVGEGMSHGEQCIMVFVQDKKSDSLKVLPDSIEGYSIVIEESGKFLSREKCG